MTMSTENEPMPWDEPMTPPRPVDWDFLDRFVPAAKAALEPLAGEQEVYITITIGNRGWGDALQMREGKPVWCTAANPLLRTRNPTGGAA
jgi:hypothetical protein